MYRTNLMLLFSISFIWIVTAHNDFVSPCPRLFAYEEDSLQPGKWFGILTMISDTDAHGVWIKLTFDRPPLQVGNWYGTVVPKSDKIYTLANYDDDLEGQVPKTIRIFIIYDPSEPPPNLVSFHVNEKLVCPEERLIGTTNVKLVLKTASFKNTTAMQWPPEQVSETTTAPAVSSKSGLKAYLSPQPSDFFGSGIKEHSKPKLNDFFQSGINEHSEPNLNDFFQSGINAHLSSNPTGDISCGTVVTRSRPLVTHGQSTSEGEFPWHVAIYAVVKNTEVYTCGASLLNKNFVITAAHCATKPKTSTPHKREYFIVYLGKHFLTRFTNEGIQDRQISEIIIHEQYNAHNFSNDIALLKLAEPAEYNDYVRPVCLWQEPINLNRIVNHFGNVVGWGFDETGKITEQLMQAKMPIVSQVDCLDSNRDFYGKFISPYTYCAGFRNGTSVCNGDSGGGMVFPKSHSDPNNPVWQLRGLVSVSVVLHGEIKCDASNYIIFTDVAKYLDWIESAIQ